MLDMLMKEEEVEEQREKLRDTTADPADKRRLEKILGVERAKA